MATCAKPPAIFSAKIVIIRRASRWLWSAGQGDLLRLEFRRKIRKGDQWPIKMGHRQESIDGMRPVGEVCIKQVRRRRHDTADEKDRHPADGCDQCRPDQ
jgi:hypothetical protein